MFACIGEYDAGTVGGRGLILTTTNGTRAIEMSTAERMILGERETAVEQCNKHWMEVIDRHAEATIIQDGEAKRELQVVAHPVVALHTTWRSVTRSADRTQSGPRGCEACSAYAVSVKERAAHVLLRLLLLEQLLFRRRRHGHSRIRRPTALAARRRRCPCQSTSRPTGSD